MYRGWSVCLSVYSCQYRLSFLANLQWVRTQRWFRAGDYHWALTWGSVCIPAYNQHGVSIFIFCCTSHAPPFCSCTLMYKLYTETTVINETTKASSSIQWAVGPFTDTLFVQSNCLRCSGCTPFRHGHVIQLARCLCLSGGGDAVVYLMLSMSLRMEQFSSDGKQNTKALIYCVFVHPCTCCSSFHNLC